MPSVNVNDRSDDQANSLASAVASTVASSSKTKRTKAPNKRSSATTGLESNNVKVSPNKVTETVSKSGSVDTPISNGRKAKAPPKRKSGQPRKLPGPKPPSPIQVITSGAANAEMMDKESGVLEVLARTRCLANSGDDDEDYMEEEAEEDDDEEEEEEEIAAPNYPKIKVEPEVEVEGLGNTTLGRVTKAGKPYDPNGRFHGRKLVMWHRPRMIEKLMLHVQYECHRRGIVIPWDHIVHRLRPGSSGSSALQHLNKLRDILVVEGHMVPPLLGKVTVQQDPSIRGFVREMSDPAPDLENPGKESPARKKTDTRVVRWDEDMGDRKKSLVDLEIVRGSGNYRKLPGSQAMGMDKVPKKEEGERRNRLPAEIQKQIQENQRKRNKGGKRNRSMANSGRAPTVDPAELPSEGEYNPSPKKKRKYGPRKGNRKSTKVESDTENDEFDQRVKASKNFTTPNKGKGFQLNTPPKSSLSIKFKLSSRALSKFPAGEQGAGAAAEQGADDGTVYDQDTGSEYKSDEDAEHEDFDEDDIHHQVSQIPFVKERLLQMSYQGIEEHGTLQQYMKAIKEGEDPTSNGIKYKRQRREAVEKVQAEATIKAEEEAEQERLDLKAVNEQVEYLASSGGPLSWNRNLRGNTNSRDFGIHCVALPNYSACHNDGTVTPSSGDSAVDSLLAMSQTYNPPFDSNADYGNGFDAGLDFDGNSNLDNDFESPLLGDGNSDLYDGLPAPSGDDGFCLPANGFEVFEAPLGRPAPSTASVITGSRHGGRLVVPGGSLPVTNTFSQEPMGYDTGFFNGELWDGNSSFNERTGPRSPELVQFSPIIPFIPVLRTPEDAIALANAENVNNVEDDEIEPPGDRIIRQFAYYPAGSSLSVPESAAESPIPLPDSDSSHDFELNRRFFGDDSDDETPEEVLARFGIIGHDSGHDDTLDGEYDRF